MISMTQSIIIPCPRGKGGEIKGNKHEIYYTRRDDVSVLRKLQGFNVEVVIFSYHHDKKILHYICPLALFFISDKPWIDEFMGKKDAQKFVSIKDMKEISLEDVQMLITKFKGGKNMTNKLGDVAKDYKSSNTKNIADLPDVSTELEVFDDEFEITDQVTKQLKVVKQKVISVNNVNYRVPASVFQQLKIIMEDNPGLKRFKVKKSGEGKDGTRYQVIPLM